jgi:hypothetical protein
VKIRIESDNRKEFVPPGASASTLAARWRNCTPRSSALRLLDPANSGKSMKQLVALVHLLGCDVDVVVHQKKAAWRSEIKRWGNTAAIRLPRGILAEARLDVSSPVTVVGREERSSSKRRASR